ncbi:MAG: flagellar basal-body rod protein FlgF [Candidatus Jordarchaeum sp.]|uniref:flagellar basal-body rod protein FlgF n=1 Tax=Candidatus Jordarchaeum sp. TaxID=2823881 RepID=UPI00404B6437
MNSKSIISTLGALRQERRFNVISNNLSNCNTVGFKKDIPIFKTIIHRSSNLSENQIGDETVLSLTQGDLQKTGNELDLAIEGEGFFKIDTPSGVRYTRAGNFKLNTNKTLVNNNGYPVLGENGIIRIDGKNIVVEVDGTVRVDGEVVGKIVLVTFNNLKALRKEGDYNFFTNNQEEKFVQKSKILQGFLENSNVDPINAMIELIETFRIYESCIKLIQSQDEMNSKSANDLGRIK